MLKLSLAAILLSAAFAAPAVAMELKSTDVTTGQSFAAQFVCPAQGGKSISPELSWSGAPAGTQSFALTIFDPDAPHGGHLHWVAVDIPATTAELPQNAGAKGTSPGGGAQLANGANHANYDGPCPPAGPAHHYHITIFAMPGPHADIPPDTGPNGLSDWLWRQSIDSAELVPLFGRK